MSWNDPCECGHDYTDHAIDNNDGECNVLDCKCVHYTADTSWTDDLDEQDLLDIEESDA